MDQPTEPHVPVAGEPAAAPSTQDAVSLLRANHSRIQALLDDAALSAGVDGGGHADRSGTVARLGAVLQAHVQMEAELLSPALATGPAPAAHARHDELLASLRALVAAEGADAAAYNVALAQMQRAFAAHIETQETKLLPQLESSDVDLLALGTRMSLRLGVLLGHQGVD